MKAIPNIGHVLHNKDRNKLPLGVQRTPGSWAGNSRGFLLHYALNQLTNIYNFREKASGHHIKKKYWRLLSLNPSQAFSLWSFAGCHDTGLQTRKLSRNAFFSQRWRLDSQAGVLSRLHFLRGLASWPAADSSHFCHTAFPPLVRVYTPFWHSTSRIRSGSILKIQSNDVTLSET